MQQQNGAYSMRQLPESLGRRFDLCNWLSERATSRVAEVRCRQSGSRLALKLVEGPEAAFPVRPAPHRCLVPMLETGDCRDTDARPDNSSHQDRFYVLMPLFAETLADRMADTPRLEDTDALTCLENIWSGLAALHRQGLAHGDLAPSNILYDTENARYLIGDFGSLRAWRADSAPATSFGTWPYAAPEMRDGLSDIDWRSDVYAAGVLAYEILTGDVPLGACEPLSALRPDLPEALTGAIDNSIRIDRRERLHTAKQLAPLTSGRPSTTGIIAA